VRFETTGGRDLSRMPGRCHEPDAVSGANPVCAYAPRELHDFFDTGLHSILCSLGGRGLDRDAVYVFVGDVAFLRIHQLDFLPKHWTKGRLSFGFGSGGAGMHATEHTSTALLLPYADSLREMSRSEGITVWRILA